MLNKFLANINIIKKKVLTRVGLAPTLIILSHDVPTLNLQIQRETPGTSLKRNKPTFSVETLSAILGHQGWKLGKAACIFGGQLHKWVFVTRSGSVGTVVTTSSQTSWLGRISFKNNWHLQGLDQVQLLCCDLGLFELRTLSVCNHLTKVAWLHPWALHQRPSYIAGEN